MTHYQLRKLASVRHDSTRSFKAESDEAATLIADVKVAEWRAKGYKGGCELVRNSGCGPASVTVYARA